MNTQKFDLKKALIFGVAILFLIPLLWIIRQRSQADLRQGMEKLEKIEALAAKESADLRERIEAAEGEKQRQRSELLSTPDLRCNVRWRLEVDPKKPAIDNLVRRVFVDVDSQSRNIHLQYSTIYPPGIYGGYDDGGSMGWEWATLAKYAERCIEKVQSGEAPPAEMVRFQ